MERIEIKANINIKNQNNELLPFLIKDNKNIDTIIIENMAKADIVFDDAFTSKPIEIYVKENSYLNLSIISKSIVNSSKILVKVEQNATFQCYFADFSFEKNNTEVIVDLNGVNARCYWHLASLSLHSDNKVFSINVNHNKPSTFATVDNYGVSRDDGRLVFSGTSYILNGASHSKTSQNAKVMVFDKLSNAVAKPILKIDENDIEANHSACVGKINDEHLFYLTSRGLTTIEAKQLITLGYLKPIINGFTDDKYKQEITQLIEGRL